jgi:hypothetical protein
MFDLYADKSIIVLNSGETSLCLMSLCLLFLLKGLGFIFMMAKAIFNFFADKPMFEACRIAYEPTPTVNSGKACQLSEDIVSVSCLPDSWAACEETPQLYFAS